MSDKPTKIPPTKPVCISYVGGSMYLGSLHSRDLELLQALKITHVLVVNSNLEELQYNDDFEKKATAPDVGMKVLPIVTEDNEGVDMLKVYNQSKVQAFLAEGTSGGNKILVHCFAGRSRSVTLIGLHLIASRGLTVLDSLLLLLSARLKMGPQDSFIQSMKDLEKQLGKPCSFDEANLPGFTCYLDRDRRAANRDFFKQKDNLARVKQLRKEDPEPEETKLEIYKSNRFKDYEPIPSDV